MLSEQHRLAHLAPLLPLVVCPRPRDTPSLQIAAMFWVSSFAWRRCARAMAADVLARSASPVVCHPVPAYSSAVMVTVVSALSVSVLAGLWRRHSVRVWQIGRAS